MKDQIPNIHRIWYSGSPSGEGYPVRNHVTPILAKLNVSDRAQATAIAWHYGLMTPEGG